MFVCERYWDRLVERNKNRNIERTREGMEVKDIEIDWLKEKKLGIKKESEMEWKWMILR